MTITQTIDIPADRRITVPHEVPTGPVVLTFTPASSVDECSLCSKHRNYETGELRFNAETIAGMQKVDDMLTGKTPNTLKKFNSLEEMLEDLDSDD